MPLSAQAKLLRVLQERIVYPIGSSKPIPINVRNMLKETGNNKAVAARRLDIDYKTLCSKLRNVHKLI
jgi:transcriptional regulator with PAS, ATPase and Fis domain